MLANDPDRDPPPYAYGNVENVGFDMPNLPGFKSGTPPIGLAGHYYEHSTGLVNMHYRWYSPRLGTFLTPDFRPPNIYDPSSFTEPYAYAAGNPVMYMDADGLRIAAMRFEQDHSLEIWITKTAEWQDYQSGKISADELSRKIFFAISESYGEQSYVLDTMERQIQKLIRSRIDQASDTGWPDDIHLNLDEVEQLTHIAYNKLPRRKMPFPLWFVDRDQPDPGTYESNTFIREATQYIYNSGQYSSIDEYQLLVIDPTFSGLRQTSSMIKAHAADEISNEVTGAAVGGLAGELLRLRRGRNIVQSSESSLEHLLQNGKVPSVRNGEFNRWFDSLSADDFQKLWASDYKEVIASRIRKPGGLHEWFMASRAPTFKRWGVSMEKIKELRSFTESLHLDPSDIRGSVMGRHGGFNSGRFHNSLLELIDSSNGYDDFVVKLQEFADYWLVGGRGSLPEGLRR